MPSKSLMSNMYHHGYLDRPPGKPVLSTYTIVEVATRLLGDKSAVGRTKVCRIDEVEALLTPCVTTGRGGAPDPSSGLDLTYSGFDKGHVIALELGGVDDEYNIVPQCRFFQQSGPWRKAEREILKIIKDYPKFTCSMKVRLTYARSPIDPRSLEMVVTDTADGSVLFQTALDNLPTDVDIRQQDKVIDRLSSFDDDDDEDMEEEVYSPPPYAAASFGVTVAQMPVPGPGQFQQQQLRANGGGSDDMDED